MYLCKFCSLRMQLDPPMKWNAWVVREDEYQVHSEVAAVLLIF